MPRNSRTRRIKSASKNRTKYNSRKKSRKRTRSRAKTKTRGGSPASVRVMNMVNGQQGGMRNNGGCACGLKGGGGCLSCGMRGGSGSAFRQHFYANEWDGSTPPGASCNQTNNLGNNDTILGCRGGGKKRIPKSKTKRRIRSPFKKKKKEPKGMMETILSTIF